MQQQGAQERTRSQAQKGARTAQAGGRAPFLRDKRPLHGPSWGAKVTETSVFQIAVPVPGERLLAPWPCLQERPHCPQEQAGHQDEPSPKHATVKELPDEDQQTPEAEVQGPEGDRDPE